MADLSEGETMMDYAGEARRIADSAIDAEARQRWLEIAASWRVEREQIDTLARAETPQ